MKISRRLLNTLTILSIVATLVLAFGYVNSLVSYKYEVQGSLIAQPNQLDKLDQHQKQIIADIANSRAEALACFILFIALLTARMIKPTFKNKIAYTK